MDNAIVPDRAAMRRHLDFLAAEAAKDALIEIAYGRPDDQPRQAQLFRLDEIEQAVELGARLNGEGCNVYVGVALRRPDCDRRRRAKDSDFYVGTAIAFDFDSNSAVGMQRLTLLYGQPGLVVQTGATPELRVQCWYHLASPTESAADFSATLKRISREGGSDPSATNAGRLMRLGGSMSYPNPGKIARGYVTELTTVSAFPDGPTITIEPGSAVAEDRTKGEDGKRAPRIDLDDAGAVERGRTWLLKGAPRAKEGARGDDATYKVAARLKDFGLSDGMVFELLWEIWNPLCSPPWSAEELAEKVARAFRYGQNAIGSDHPAAAFEGVSVEPPVSAANGCNSSSGLAGTRPANHAEIARLAQLSPIDCDREIKAAAQRLGCRTETLRAAVRSARATGALAAGQGRPVELREPEPWPNFVDGAALLDEMAEAIDRHVILNAASRDAVTLWCVGVHAFDSFDIFPRLFVTAPTKGAGKTTALDTIERLVPRPLAAANASAAAIFRAIPAMRPVLLLDEGDAWVRDNEDVRAVIDAGHKRGGLVLRCVGDENEPRAFDVFAPVALAAIGRLPDTIEDRSIIVPLRRKLPHEGIESLRAGRVVLERLARQAARWALDSAAALASAEPEMPSGIINRTADNWTALLAVADLAGGDWPARASRAAMALTRGEDQSLGVMLLADTRGLFGAGEHIMSSDEMARRLREQP